VQDDVQQGLMNVNASAVRNVTKLSKPVHELADPGADGAIHLRKGLLRDCWNQCLRLPGIDRLGYQQKRLYQRLFTLVQELINQVFLYPDCSHRYELQEHI
jgi:hypothetical protein